MKKNNLYIFLFFLLVIVSCAYCVGCKEKKVPAGTDHVVISALLPAVSVAGTEVNINAAGSYNSDPNVVVASISCVVITQPAGSDITVNSGGNGSFSCRPLMVGVYTFKITATCNNNEVATDFVSVEVVPLTVEECFYKQGDNFITVETNAGTDAKYTFWFTPHANPVNYPEQSSPIFTFNPIPGETYYCWVKVNNGGVTADNREDKLVFTIPDESPANLNPEITDSSAPDISTTVGTAVNLFVATNDPDGNNELLRYHWSTEDNAVFSNPNSPQTTVTYSLSGIYTVSVAVRDNEGGLAQHSSIITVANIVDPQIEDPNSLTVDDEKIEGDDITLYRDGILEIRNFSKYLNEIAAYEGGVRVDLLAKLNDWVLGDHATVDLANDTVRINLDQFNLAEGNYGIGMAVAPEGADLSGVNWWQYYQFSPKDKQFFGYNDANPPGIVFIFQVKADGSFDNLPPETVVDN